MKKPITVRQGRTLSNYQSYVTLKKLTSFCPFFVFATAAVVRATGTNSASSAGTTPILSFSTTGTTGTTFTTCTSADISWCFVGPVEDVTLTVTNVNVTQQAAPSSSSSVFSTGGINTFTNFQDSSSDSDSDGDDDKDDDDKDDDDNDHDDNDHDRKSPGSGTAGGSVNTSAALIPSASVEGPSSLPSKPSPALVIAVSVTAVVASIVIILLIVWWRLKRKKPLISSAAVLESQERDPYHSHLTSPADIDKAKDDPEPLTEPLVDNEAATRGQLPESSARQTQNRPFLRPLPPIPVSFNRFNRFLQRSKSTSTHRTASSAGYGSGTETLPRYSLNDNVSGSPPGYKSRTPSERADSVLQDSNREKWG
ncbi:hypothetical protein K435DRAFT_797464 [Dendrothele bispora CBS 962.96]|uniref:Uncharacterized protein n=1 Tax=Dendrothele bispora (strain CBS 962.96) TaxID=1314807 RepID=A0A4S8M3F2_DENBC|nr:hypothetical protein K435DRAFT_797464 [Dendrothele bispora CBS 962.96]